MAEVANVEFAPTLQEIEEGKIHLTKQEDIWWGWRWTRLTVRNPGSVAIAFSLSAAGQGIAGVGKLWGRSIGPVFSGAGNAASTSFFWEKEHLRVIEKRVSEDFPIVRNRVARVSEEVSSLFGCVFSPEEAASNRERREKLVEEAIKAAVVAHPILKRVFFRENRYLGNSIRLGLAGGFTFIGGILGGYAGFLEDEEEKAALLALASLYAGAGNGLSTYLSFEKDVEKIIFRRIMEELPALVQRLEKAEVDLTGLKLRVKELLGEETFSKNFQPRFPPPPIVVETYEPKPDCPCMFGRTARNLTRCGIAGGLSGLGQWISTYPSYVWIVLGSVVSAIANMLSTWMYWERSLDKEIEKTATKDFPQVFRKLMDAVVMLQLLDEELKKWEKASTEEMSVNREVDASVNQEQITELATEEG